MDSACNFDLLGKSVSQVRVSALTPALLVLFTTSNIYIYIFVYLFIYLFIYLYTLMHGTTEHEAQAFRCRMQSTTDNRTEQFTTKPEVALQQSLKLRYNNEALRSIRPARVVLIFFR